MSVERCERCELPIGQCEHTRVVRATPAADPLRTVLVSRRKCAHLGLCSHKDDDDFSTWGRIEGVPRAWERIGNGEHLPVNAGARLDLVATWRCSECESKA